MKAEERIGATNVEKLLTRIDQIVAAGGQYVIDRDRFNSQLILRHNLPEPKE